MKKLITIAFALLITASVMGQEEQLRLLGQNEQSWDVEKGIWKINFLPLSFSYEFRIEEAMTLMIEPSFGFNWTSEGTFYYSPNVRLYYRYYYNFQKRNYKGKRTAKNSVNYVGAVMYFSFWNAAWSANLNTDDYIRYFGFGPVWGIQRNYTKHFSLGINLGPTISVGNYGVRPDAIVMLTLGFWLGS
jgi:hypothetical protein